MSQTLPKRFRAICGELFQGGFHRQREADKSIALAANRHIVEIVLPMTMRCTFCTGVHMSLTGQHVKPQQVETFGMPQYIGKRRASGSVLTMKSDPMHGAHDA